MGFLRPEEVRRLLTYLRERIEDHDRLAQIEDELSGEFAEEFVREPEILELFPPLVEEFITNDATWKLRIIPHAHLRLIQRGIKLPEISTLFLRFLEASSIEGKEISIGGYVIYGRPRTRAPRMTVRIDVDSIADDFGECHIVTVYLGRGDIENMTLIDLD